MTRPSVMLCGRVSAAAARTARVEAQMVGNKNLTTVRGIYDAFARGDLASVVAAMHPQIEWNQAENFPYADGNPYIGPDAVVKGVFTRLASEWDGWTLDIEALLDAGERIVALGRYVAKNKSSGVKIHAQFAHVWTLDGDQVRRFQQYADTAQVARAVHPK